MAGYKETPRQKMIAMMYLVLTALLALNVSKQILDAFVLVNESMETTNENFAQKLDNTYSKFKIQYQLNPGKVKPFWDKAQKAHTLSNGMAAYIDSLKYTLIQITDGMESYQAATKVPLKDTKRKDNYDRGTTFFIGQSHDGSSGEARKLKNRIVDYRNQLLGLVDEKYRGNLKIGLDTEGPYYDMDGKKQNWEMHNFYRTILAADVTILNKIKAEVFNAEFDVTNNLLSSISAEDFKYDKIDARVIPKSRYVFLGDDYDAEIVVAAYDTKSNPMVSYMMGADTLTPANFKNATALTSENGVVRLKLPGSGEGLKKYAGIIKMISPLGDTLTFHFKDEFIVAKPGLTISPSKMNVFYIGVDNPVDITVPGSPEKVIPSISVGKIRQEGKGFIVYDLPKSGAKEAVINVSAVFSGKAKSMGNYTARLKRVPDPEAKIAGKRDGFIAKNLLLASPYVICEMPVGFDFDLKFQVVSFDFVTDQGGDVQTVKVNGNRFNSEIIGRLQNAKKNKRIYIENITVRGPDGDRNIPSFILKIN
ncbi:MAG: gliding motility protein GldM [Syntrophothermus sp.]